MELLVLQSFTKTAASQQTARYQERFDREEARVRKGDRMLWADVANEPVFEVPLAPLFQRLKGKKVWGRGKLAPQDVLSGKAHGFRGYQHSRLLQEADTSYPIILRKDGRVLDGVHRIMKAHGRGDTTIKAVTHPTL